MSDLDLQKLQGAIAGSPDLPARLRGLEIDPGAGTVNGQGVEKIGEGTRGVVYRIYDRELQSSVALKLDRNWLRGELGSRETRMGGEKLLRDTLGGSWPATLVPIQEADPWGRMILMEFCRDGNWENPRPNDRRILEKNLLPLLSTLAELHGRNLVHRDLKPGNFLVTDDGRLLFIDFDTLEKCDDAGHQLVGGTPGGTLAYLAPELMGLDGTSPNLKACDCWSLGMTLCEKALGINPVDEYLETFYGGISQSANEMLLAARFINDVTNYRGKWRAFLKVKLDRADPPLGPLLRSVLEDLLDPDRRNARSAEEILENLEKEGEKREHREEYGRF
jgi:serine/threonine protein kinase